MTFGDTVNGLFETLGAFFTWMNAWKLHKDQDIKGVYWPITAFFAAWGLWNLYYYPSLGQWFSFFGGCVLVLGNLLWVGQAIKLTLKKRAAPAVVFKGEALLREIKGPTWTINAKRCEIPPDGWVCTREPGHEGPCAAWRVP